MKFSFTLCITPLQALKFTLSSQLDFRYDQTRSNIRAEISDGMIQTRFKAGIYSQSVKQGRVKHITSRDVSHILMVCHGLVMVTIPLIRDYSCKTSNVYFFAMRL